MPEDVMFLQAVDALRNGQRARSRDLLTRLLRVDQKNAQYWLWLSAAVDTPKEQIYCLQSALRYDPDNQTIRQGLVLLGALPAGSQIQPRLQQRLWQVVEQEIPRRNPLGNPWVRSLIFTISALVVIALFVWAGISFNARHRKPVAYFPTATPGPSPTFTLTPTAIQGTLLPATPTPTQSGPLSLAQKLNLNYTPTPIYVNTPHPANEAFRIALRSFHQGDSEEALNKFFQASKMDPKAPDILYLIAEIYYAQKDYPDALKYYQKAIEIMPDFGPAYLGVARSRIALDRKADVLEDLQQSIELDPQFAPAHLDLIAYYLQKKEIELAQDQLEASKDVLEQNAMWRTYQAQVAVAQVDYPTAYEQAKQALSLDRGLLPVYRIVGQTALLSEKYKEALSALEIYLDYETEDAQAWMWMGQALYKSGRYRAAVEALDTALKYDSDMPEAFYTRGLAYLELKEGQQAVNNFIVSISGNTQSFIQQLDLARALLVAGRYSDAHGQLNKCENLAKNNEELAQVYYYRALAAEGLENRSWAIKDWKALLALPKDSFPEKWRKQAAQQLTPTPTVTPTPTSSKTPTPTTTSTNTPTPATRSSFTPTSTQKP